MIPMRTVIMLCSGYSPTHTQEVKEELERMREQVENVE